MAPETADGAQYREPGVKYRRVKKQRQVVTTIDGVEATYTEDYYVDEPVPPKDWETVVLRGVIGLAIFLTSVAFVGTATSVGGLFTKLLPPAVGYSLGLVFTASWVGCLALEWLDGRIDPDRAKLARCAGCVALVIGMGAVFTYGATNGQPWVGAAGACVDLLAKGFWSLLLHRSQVRLSKGVAAWVVEQEQKAAGRALFSERLRKLNSSEAYRRAVGGREYQAAQSITTRADTPSLHAPPLPGRTPDMPAPQTQPAPPPGQPSGPVSGQVAPPVPPASGQHNDAPGQDTNTVPDKEPDTSGDDVVRPIGALSIASTIRAVLKSAPDITDAELREKVAAVHGQSDRLAETVRRTRARIEKQTQAS